MWCALAGRGVIDTRPACRSACRQRSRPQDVCAFAARPHAPSHSGRHASSVWDHDGADVQGGVVPQGHSKVRPLATSRRPEVAKSGSFGTTRHAQHPDVCHQGRKSAKQVASSKPAGQRPMVSVCEDLLPLLVVVVVRVRASGVLPIYTYDSIYVLTPGAKLAKVARMTRAGSVCAGQARFGTWHFDSRCSDEAVVNRQNTAFRRCKPPVPHRQRRY